MRTLDELLIGIRARDPGAITEACERYRGPLRSDLVSRGYSRADADDALQHLFGEWLEVPRWLTGEQLTTYLFKRARWSVFGLTHRSSRVFGVLTAEVDGVAAQLEDERYPGEQPDEVAIWRERLAGVARVLARLEPRQREVLLACELEPLEQREIGDRLGIREASVRDRLYTARQRFDRWAAVEPSLQETA